MERSSVHIAVLVVAEDPATVDLAAATFLSDRVASTGHRVVAQEIVEASEAAIRDQLSRWIGQGHIDAIMSVGATEPAVAALIPLVTAPLQGLTDQLRLLARDRGGEGKPAAARCSKKFVFLLPAEVPALGPVLNQLVLPQLDSTQQRNLVSDMPRHNAIPQSLPSEKTASGAGLVPKLPARDKRKTGANVIARAAKIDDPTKPIELDSLERKLAQEEQAARFPSHDAPTRPHIDIASMLPAVPPGADETAETPAVPADPRRPATWDDVATPPPLTVQPSRLRSGPVGVAVGNNDKTVVRPTPTNDDKTAIRPAPTRPTLSNDDKTAIRPAPTRPEPTRVEATRPEPTSAGRSDDKTAVRAAPTRPASQTSRGVQPTPTIGSPMVRPAPLGAIGVSKATVPSAVPSVKPALPSVVPSVPSVVPVIPKQPAAAAPESTKEQTTPGVMSPLAKPRAMPASGPTSTPTSGPTSTAATITPATSNGAVAGASVAKAPPTPTASSPVAKASVTSTAGYPVAKAPVTSTAGYPVAKAPVTPTASSPVAKAPVTSTAGYPVAKAPVTSTAASPVAKAPPTPVAGSPVAAGSAIAKAPPTPAAASAVATPSDGAPRASQPTPISGVQAATAVSVSQANPPEEPDAFDTLARAAAAGASPAVLAALAADAEELDPASSADIIEAMPAEAASFDTRTPPPVPTPAVTAPPMPTPPAHTPPPTPRAPARPAIVPQMTQTPIDAKTAEAKLAAQARSATPPAVTRLASADLPRSPDFAQPELLDLSEGIAKKRRSRTGTALVRRKKSTSILMYLALIAAAVAGFFAVVHFFPHGEPTQGTSPPRGSDVAIGTGSAGSAEAVAMGTGSAGSIDVVAKGSDATDIDVDTAGSDTTAGAHPTGAGTPDTTKPDTTKPETTKPDTTKPETTKPETTKPETTRPGTKPAITKPGTKPETTKPETTKPETTKPETTKPATTKPEVAAEDGCDEVSCVLEKYQRACCERFKPADSGFHPKNEVPDALDKSMVIAGIEKVKPKVIACGEKIAAKGTVKLAITVAPAGNISDISVSDTPDPALGQCVLAAVKRASFGKSVNGASFTFPFAF